MTWNQFLLLAQQQGGTAAVIVILIGLIAVLIKFWEPIRKFFHVMEEVTQLPHTLSEIKTELEIIKKEVLPNGGSSLRDSVNRTEVEVAYLKGHLGMTPAVKPKQKVGTRG
jgi:hypothetical protein